MALVVGLDIGTRTLNGAVFSGSASKFQLVDFFTEEIPIMGAASLESSEKEEGDEDDTFQAPMSVNELVGKVLKERNLKNADVIAGVDSKDCVFREIQIPFTREEQIRRTVPFEAENYFHAFDLEEVVLEYVKTGESDGKSRLVLIALRNDVIEERLRVLKDGDCDPISLDLDEAALCNAFSLSPYYDPEKSALLIDMGATTTKIVLIEKGRLKKMRSLRAGVAIMSPERMIPEPAMVAAGAANTDDAAPADEYSIEARFREIEEALKRLDPVPLDDSKEDATETPIAILPDEEYDRLRQEVQAESDEDEPPESGDEPQGSFAPGNRLAGGRTPPSLPGSRQRAETRGEGSQGLEYDEYLARVGTEIQRTFATLRLDSPIELICVTGGLSRRPETTRYFSEEFDLETVELDFGENLPSDLEPDLMDEVGAEGAVAVGLALKGVGRDMVGLDFRKGRFRYEHRFERLKIPLLACSVLALFFFLQTAFWAYHEYDFQSKRVQGYRAQQAAVYKAFFGKDLVTGRDPLVAAKGQRDRWEGGGVGDVGQFVSYTDVAYDLGKVMNATGIHFTIQNLSLNLKVRRVAAGSGKNKGTRLKGQDSQLQITTDDSRANLTLDRKFKELSQYFTAESDSRPNPKGGFRVTVTLRFKDSALVRMEG